MAPINPVTESSAVVLVSQSTSGIQVLLGQRAGATPVAPGMWVFPGGGLTPAELAAGESGYRQAAARELAEEVPQNPWRGDAQELLPMAHWDTPEFLARRFSTRFYLGVSASGLVCADQHELVKVQWFSPAQAREVLVSQMLFPTWALLAWLEQFDDTAGLLTALSGGPLPRVRPVLKAEAGEQWLEIGAPQYPLRRWTLTETQPAIRAL